MVASITFLDIFQLYYTFRNILEPILETILGNLIGFGFHQFYFAVNYKAEMIEDYFGDGSRWKVKINYLKEKKV